MNQPITIKTHVQAPIEKIWEYWTEPEHIKQWNNASDDWCTPSAKNDLRVGGTFSVRMESKDGMNGFDFEGTYTSVEKHDKIAYIMSDGRKVHVVFTKQDDGYTITETFDPENENSLEMQKAGWQSILNNFKKYVENK